MNAQGRWLLEAIHATDCMEWHVATGFTAHGVSPGYAIIKDDRRILHFTSRCLLAINHQGTVPVLAVTADAIPVNVTGKWRGYRLSGVHARSVLAAGTHANLILKDRACAALSLFDCPVVLLRTEDAYETWVVASYAESLCAALNKVEKML